jgi:hypothetical protein
MSIRRSTSAFAFVLVLALAPLTAGAVATNLTLSTPTGPAVRQQVIVIDRSTGKEVDRKESDDRGAVAFDLPSGGSYQVQTRSGYSSETFRVGASPVNLALTLSAMSAGATTAEALDFLFDLEVGYSYTGGSFDTSSFIDLGFLTPPQNMPVSDSVSLSTNGAMVGGRVHFPVEVIHARPYFEVHGGIFPTVDRTGATFGWQGITGLNTTEVKLNSSVSFGGGLAWTIPAGPTAIGIRPSFGFAFDNGRVRSVLDESAFTNPLTNMPYPITETNKSFTTTSAVFGGYLEFQPSAECGFYIFGGGHYRVPISGDDVDIRNLTPGGFDALNEVSVGNRWDAHAGVGYRFSSHSLWP